MPDDRILQAVKWLDQVVPGFSGAYLQSAEFHAVIDAQLQLLIKQVELMVCGAAEIESVRKRLTHDEMTRQTGAQFLLKNGALARIDPSRGRQSVVADSEQGMKRGE